MSKLIDKAYNFAKNAHKGQIRKFTGLDYFDNHVVPVVELVKKLSTNITEEVICAAYLHDTIEDCNVSYKTLEKEFNTIIATLVFELTNVYTKEAFPNLNRNERKYREHERISKISSLAKYIKLCDRIHNLESLFKEDATCKELGVHHYYYKESASLFNVLCDNSVSWFYLDALITYCVALSLFEFNGHEIDSI